MSTLTAIADGAIDGLDGVGHASTSLSRPDEMQNVVTADGRVPRMPISARAKTRLLTFVAAGVAMARCGRV